MTYLVTFGIPALFALVGWLILKDIDQWIDHARRPHPWATLDVDKPQSIRELTSGPAEMTASSTGGGAQRLVARVSGPEPYDQEADRCAASGLDS